MVMNTNENAIEIISALMPNRGQIEAVDYLPGGYSNDNFRFRIDAEVFVVRIVRTPSPRPFERYFASLSVAPELIAFDTSSGHMITRWVEGDVLTTNRLSPIEGSRYLRELHDAIPSSVTRYDVTEHIARYFEAAGQAGKEQLWLERIRWKEHKIRGCHNDLNPWNIIRTETGMRTLDWESAGDNDPLFDVIGFCYGSDYEDAESLLCAETYLGGRLSEETLRKTQAIFQLREHAWAISQISAGNDRDEIIEQRDQSIANVQHLL